MAAIVIVIPLNPHVLATRSMIPLLDHHVRWRDANYNLGRPGAEGQCACKDQADQALENHDALHSVFPQLCKR
jgi:hypothetical protein